MIEIPYGAQRWDKYGYNSDIQSSEECITPQGGAYVFPTVLGTLTAVSDSANDAAAGTGARTVTVYYTNDSYAAKSATVALDGTTPVTVATDFFRMNNARVATVGSGGKAAGNISFKVGATVYGYIAAGHTRQRQFVYTVPAGKRLKIKQINIFNVNTAANKRLIATLRATWDEKAMTRLTAGIHFMPYGEYVLSDNPVSIIYAIPKYFPEKVDIVAVGISNGTSSPSIMAAGWLEDM